jgi:flagellar hook-associated protein 3 FlgL
VGTLRVTQGMIVARSLSDLSRQTRRLLRLQEQLATGLKVNSPSDDPLAARRAVNIRSVIAKQEQYLTNISSAGPVLQESGASLQTVVSALQRTNELALQGANGTSSQSQMEALAIEVNQLIESTLTEANHQTNGRYVFGGTRTLNAPFVATRDAEGQITDVTYEGNEEAIKISVTEGISVQINETGQSAFSSDQDILQMLIDIRDNLMAGDKTSLQTDRLIELGNAQDQLLMSMAALGATQNRMDALTANLEESVDQLRVTLSDNIDADYAETVINLNAQSNAYQAALEAAARVIQPSLLDFIG